MSSVHFNLNKPVHLARRDAHFERAVELLYMQIEGFDIQERIAHAEQVLSLLKTAEKHAFFATQADVVSGREQEFLHFLRLISHNVQSIHSMMQHQSFLEAEESFLCQFLNTTPERCVLPAMHYRRRADDLHQGVWHLLRLAHSPYRELQKEARAQMNEDQRSRYEKAYHSFRDELNPDTERPADQAAAGA